VDDFILRYPEVSRLPYLSSRESVAEAMASADVFLALGRFETFGLAGLEAIACGTVPVFPDRGASAEMAESLGILPPYRADSPESLAASVEEAVRVSRRGMAGELRSFAVSRYGWTDSFRRMEGFYEMILKAHRRGDLDSLHPPGDWW
jgi:glycosyltransferase involved in cell wall biosynthesis